MRNAAWDQALSQCADPQRAGHYLKLLRGTSSASVLQKMGVEPAAVLLALLSGSQAQGELLAAHPDWLGPLLKLDTLRQPRGAPALRHAWEQRARPLWRRKDYAAILAALRQWRQQALLRIAARDLARLSTVGEITLEVSDVADLCLDTVYEVCRQQMLQRLGQPWHLNASQAWQRTEFCVLGMGKLGGQELNYSSDVDVLFVYAEEGSVFKDPPRAGESASQGLSNHQFFKRLAEAFVAEVSRLAPEGPLYRIDLRLRPEGNAGPLVRSLPSYENYYAQWGQTWERMMLIKARRVAGEPALAAEFAELIQSFRYPRSLSEQALRDIAGMKQRIESEVVKAGEIDRNVKLGRGGIREIEFVAQTLQMLHAGRHPFVADAQTVRCLQKMVRYQLLPGSTAEVLIAAYQFLRDVEHRLQMDNDRQTHTIPTERRERDRLARLMGFDCLQDFEAALDDHRRRVREVYDGLLRQKAPGEAAPALPELAGREAEWKQLLGQRRFRDPDQALRLVTALLQGPGFGHVSVRTEELARQLLARLLAMCPRKDRPITDQLRLDPDGDPAARLLSDPDRVLARLDSFIAAYGARALLFETWASNPSLFDLVVLLFDRSEFLAETAIRTPDLVDELELSGRLRRSKSSEQTLKDLRHGLDDPDQRLWIRRYHQAEFMRIGLRDILGLADYEQNLVELSALAEACLQYALEVVLRRHGFASPPLAIVGLGKLGGAELNYGSDLDVVFVADDRVKNLPLLQRLAVDMIDLLSSQTELGVAFQLDARLRPDGEKGLLVNKLKAYEDYYCHRAQLWEIQALSRSRPIAGHAEVGERFQALVATLTDFSRPDCPVAANKPGWVQDIARMRQRIEKERTPAGKDPLAIKTGAGGLVDAEFIAQWLCLAHGWQEPNTLQALQRAKRLAALSPAEADRLIDNYRRLRRVEAILRRWSYAGENTLPDDPAPLYRVAMRCGFPDADAFMAAVKRYRASIRAVYQRLLGPGQTPTPR